MVYINIVDSVRPVLLCKKNRDLLGRSNNPSIQHYNPMIHQQFQESKIQVVILPLKCHKANQSKLFQAVMQENAR